MEHEEISLREYLESRLEAMEHAKEAAFDSMNRRLESMNEFRSQLRDQSAQFVTKEEHGRLHDTIAADIRMLRESKAEISGKASVASVILSNAMSIIAIAVAIISIVTRRTLP